MATVLVIDDEDDIRMLAELGLKASGLRVVTASGGAEGVEAARAESPDLIVLDMMMPDMDGIETLAALRADPATARIPVVVLTARNMTAAEETLRSQGVVDFVAKPFVPRDLVAHVRAALAG
jgi:CheY-like chemotaxis protein